MARHKIDEETAAVATERLARLLAELTPRRAMPGVGVDEEDEEDEDEFDDDPEPPPVRRRPEGRTSPPDRVVDRARDADRALDADRSPADRSPADWGTRAQTFGRRHLGVLALILVLGLVVGGWALLRARPVAVANPLVVATTSAGPAAGAGSPGQPAETAAGSPSSARASPSVTPAPKILVHVIGAVRTPSVVALPAGSRVKDAIDAADGLTADARPGQLNLAQVLRDGQQVVVGSRREPDSEVRDVVGGGATDDAPAGGGTAGAGGSSTGTVDLNAATAAQLDTLPGVGPVTAERIIAWRTEHQRFSRVEELQEVDGIGPKTYAQIAPRVRV